MKKWISLLVLATLIASPAFAKQEMLVYCGITMKKPMEEIARNFEAKEGVSVKFSFGGSGNLKKSIETNQVGDLFLPGSDSYIKAMNEAGLIEKSAYLGVNRAALIVQKGNPAGLKDLNALLDEENGVVLAKANSGSIGKATKKILESHGIYEQAMENALYLTTDSKDIVNAIKSGDADVTINWYATSLWPENKDYMDAIKIEGVKSKKLVLGVLKYAQDKDLAEKFMNYASSEEGLAIMKKYGF